MYVALSETRFGSIITLASYYFTVFEKLSLVESMILVSATCQMLFGYIHIHVWQVVLANLD